MEIACVEQGKAYAVGGARDGSVLMDNCLYDLYSKCHITYDAAISRARNTDRFKPNAD